jgi:glyoxylase-like metal-dependent hydrolase (beta-lactamase superfamily II)
VSSPAEVSEGVWLINLPLPFPVGSINVYMIRSSDGFLLLDCGLKTKACREALAGALAALGVGWPGIRRLVITHLHPDHFGLAAELRGLAGCEVMLHSVEAAHLPLRLLDNDFFSRHSAWLAEHGVPPDESEEISQVSRGIQEFVDTFDVDRKLEDGDRLSIAAGELEVLWTPGHSPGLLTFYERRRRLYFSSDHMIEKITPNIGLHTHSSENPLGEYLASLERLCKMEIDLVLPSHGQPFRGHREWIRATEEHHRARCERMIAAVAGAPQTAYEVVTVEWGPHLSPLNERFAVAETLAHLEYLRRQGRVAAARENGLVRWKAT